MSLIIINQPATEPVTLAEAKLHCKVDDSADDTLITALIVSARERAQHCLGRALITQTLEQVLDTFPNGIKLPLPPAKTIVSVNYINPYGIQQTLAAETYELDKDSSPGWLVPAYGFRWPDSRAVPNAVRVRYTAGYGAAADVPASIKSWMLLAIGTLYSQREVVITGAPVQELPNYFFDGLLDPYRVYQL